MKRREQARLFSPTRGVTLQEACSGRTERSPVQSAPSTLSNLGHSAGVICGQVEVAKASQAPPRGAGTGSGPGEGLL